MAIDIRAPDGSIARFPDGMSDEAITAVMRKEFGGPSQPAPPRRFEIEWPGGKLYEADASDMATAAAAFKKFTANSAGLPPGFVLDAPTSPHTPSSPQPLPHSKSLTSAERQARWRGKHRDQHRARHRDLMRRKRSGEGGCGNCTRTA